MYNKVNKKVIERVLPGLNTKNSNQTKVNNSLEKVIVNNDSNNNLSDIENPMRAFGEYICKFPSFVNFKDFLNKRSYSTKQYEWYECDTR